MRNYEERDISTNSRTWQRREMGKTEKGREGGTEQGWGERDEERKEGRKEEGLIKDTPRIGKNSYTPSVTLNHNAFLHVIINTFLKRTLKSKMTT